MAKTFVLMHSLLIWALVLNIVRLSFAASEEIQGSGSNGGSGEEPTEISDLCDDEDSACDPEIKSVSRKTTNPLQTTTTTTTQPTPTISIISWTSPHNHVVTMATTTSSVSMYTIGQPRFRGNSFMALPRLPVSSRRSVELSILFKADDGNGLLLYAGRRSKRKDFFAVGLVNGFVELRFSNGADTVTIKTLNSVTLGTWHRVVVYRYQRDGYLTLDYGQLISGTADHNLNLMNLNTPLYLGGLPEFNVESIPYHHGFDGCVKELVVDGKKLDLRLPGGDAAMSNNIDECKKSIKQCLCENGGTCQYTSTGEWQCACPLGTAGQHCEREVTLKIPSFTGHSYLSYPSTGKLASNSFTISVTLKSSAETGLILLNTDRAEGRGDFYSLSLREGIVEFLFDCGSGAAVLRSHEPINIDQWHTITMWRTGNKGSLTVDDGLPVYGESPGRLHHISLRQNLYIGGIKDYKHQPNNVEMESGFVGCIQKVTINFSSLNLTSPLSGVNIDNCDHVCVTQSICQNGGNCHADMSGFQCQCSIGYTGMFCDKRLDIKMPSFPGRSYLSFHPLGKKAYKSFIITLVLRPSKDTGLILYNGQHGKQRGDFVSLALRKGFLEFSFDCGSGAAKLRSTSKVLVDQWYTITISRDVRKGQLIIDDGNPVLGESRGHFRYITLNGDLFLGGMENYAQQPLASAVKMGFVGCIQKVTVNSKPLDLSSYRSGMNVRNCDHVCVTHYVCMNGGTCHADMDNFQCQCAMGYTGIMCDTVVTPNIHYFDGTSFVKITKKKIMRRISGSTTNIKIHVKIRSNKAVLLYVYQTKSQRKTYFMIGVNNGKVEVRYKNGDAEEQTLQSQHLVNDDQWHKVHFRRTSSAWSLQVDDVTTENKLQHKDSFDFHRGELFLGGLPDHVTYFNLPNLDGSLKQLVIGGYTVDVTYESVVGIQARYRISNVKYSLK